MAPNPATLFEVVGIVLPLSFIGLRILLDEIDELGGIPDAARAKGYMTHAVGMVALLVLGAWLATLELLVPGAGLPFVELGYLAAALGMTVPLWLLVGLRSAFDVSAVSTDS